MRHQEQPSSLSLAILGLISQEPRTGYDLRRVFAATPMGHFSASPGAVYPALERLVKEGQIKGIVDRSRALRPKRRYTLTDQGAKRFEEILSRPVDRSDVIWRLDDLLLRFAFMGGILGRKRTLSFLEEVLKGVEDHIAWLQEQRRALPQTAAPYGWLAMGHGITTYRATARWVKGAIRQLGKR